VVLVDGGAFQGLYDHDLDVVGRDLRDTAGRP
jgi:hypothetical protein